MHDGAERKELARPHHSEAIAAVIELTDRRFGDRNDVLADKSVPRPIGHQVADLDGPAFGGFGAFGDLGPLDNADGQDGPFGAALEQREKRSEHGGSLPQNGVQQQRLRGWIDAALEGSGWSYEEIMEGVQSGDFHLFMHDEGCMVGEFITSPRHKVMHVFAAGGTMKAITDLLPTVEAFGRMHGCDSGGATGRKGWTRFLKQYGYDAADPAVTKEL